MIKFSLLARFRFLNKGAQIINTKIMKFNEDFVPSKILLRIDFSNDMKYDWKRHVP